MSFSSRPAFTGKRAARTIRNRKATFFSNGITYLASVVLPHGAAGVGAYVVAAMLLVFPMARAQSTAAGRGLFGAPFVGGRTAPIVLASISPLSLGASTEDEESGRALSQEPPPPPAPTSPSTQAPGKPAGSSVSPDLKSQPDLGREQLKKQENQRILGIVPAFNSVYEGTVPPLTPREKFSLMWKSTTDPYVFVFAAFTAGIGQAQNSHADYGQGVTGYLQRFGANYVDTADGNFWGNAVLPIVLHEDPRYFRLGHGSFPHRLLYSMSTTVICKRDDGTTGPNYANVLGNLIAGGISNFYYPAEDRGVGQTFQNAATVTAEGMIGAGLIEFWPDIRHHYHVKRQAKRDAAAAAARNAQISSQATRPQQ